MIDDDLSNRVNSWLKLVRAFTCNECDQERDLRKGQLVIAVANSTSSLAHSGANPISSEQIEQYFCEHLRCRRCGARNASVWYMTADELSEEQQKRDEREQSRVDRERNAAKESKYLEERAEGKHGFWAEDKRNVYLTGGTIAYDPTSGARDITYLSRIDGNK